MDFKQLLNTDHLVSGVLQSSASPSEEDRWIEVLRSLNEPTAVRDGWAGFAAGVLMATPSSRIRNAAALALADMGAKDAGSSIVEVLRRPEVATASGTLLYALSELDASIPLSVLVGLIENGSYESRAEALSFLEEGRIDRPSEGEVEQARERLAFLAEHGDTPDGIEAARTALGFLDAQRDFAAS